MIVFESLENAFPKEDTAIAVGYFDGVHRAHRSVIEKAVSFKEKGLSPMVFSFTTIKNTPEKKKGALLLQSFFQKTRSIEALGASYFLCPPFSSFMGLSPKEFAVDLLAGQLHAKAVVCGYDYRFGKGASGNADTLRELLEPLGAEVYAVDAVLDKKEPISSTRIRELLKDGSIEEANRLLGYDFAIDYEVVHGRHLGNTLGFPTINQIFPEYKIAPRFGVYKTSLDIDGKSYLGVTNVGRKPTVGATGFISAETYIDCFDGDLYGKKIELSFQNFLRPEEKFPSIEKLKEAIANDVIHARKIKNKEK